MRWHHLLSKPEARSPKPGRPGPESGVRNLKPETLAASPHLWNVDTLNHHAMPDPFRFSLDALQVFESAARLGSFKAAAAELSVTPTAVSHRIRALEEALGCALFHRQVRAITLTPEGEQLQAGVSRGLQEIAACVDRIRHPLRQTVTVSMTPEFAAQWLVPRLAHFQGQHPDIALHVHASYETADLDAGVADLAIRYGQEPLAGVEAIPLFRERFGPVASPVLCRQLGPDPRTWPLIWLTWYRPAHRVFDWPAWAEAAGLPADALTPGNRYSDGTLAVQAAVAGQGVALLGLPLLTRELETGLLEVLPGPVLEGYCYHVCAPVRRAGTPAMQKVRAWIEAEAQFS